VAGPRGWRGWDRAIIIGSYKSILYHVGAIILYEGSHTAVRAPAARKVVEKEG
jgi:hypothetical protein